jgi:hypothetical protein
MIGLQAYRDSVLVCSRTGVSCALDTFRQRRAGYASIRKIEVSRILSAFSHSH